MGVQRPFIPTQDTLEAADDVTIERSRDHARLAAPRGNALGQVMLQGWSSEFDNEPNLYDSVYTDSHESDYTSAPLGIYSNALIRQS